MTCSDRAKRRGDGALAFFRRPVALLALAAGVAACRQDTTVSPPLAQVDLTLGISFAGAAPTLLAATEVIDVSVGYVRSSGAFVTLASQPIDRVSGRRNVGFVVDVATCLTDSLRVPAGAGCPLVARVVLRDGVGAALYSAQTVPVQARPGESLLVPQITFLKVAAVSVTTVRPDWSLGDTGTALVVARDSANVPLPVGVRWRSSAPAILSVDSVTGRFTATGLGTATLTASAQGVDGSRTFAIQPASPNPRCRGAGQTRVDTAQYSMALNLPASGSPYVMADGRVLVSGRLDIPAGVTICAQELLFVAAGGATIRAVGSTAAPVVFTPRNDTSSRSSFTFQGAPSDSSRFESVFFDRAGNTDAALVLQDDAHPVALSSVRFRQVASPRAIWARGVGAGVRLSDVVVDTTAAVFPAGAGSLELEAAVTVNQRSAVERTTVRAAGRTGVEILTDSVPLALLRITDVTVLDAATDGFIAKTTFANPRIVATGIRVSRSGRYPVVSSAPNFARLFPTEASQQALLGNARDTAQIQGNAAVRRDTLRAYGVLPLVLSVFAANLDSGAVFEANPGTSIALRRNAFIITRSGARLRFIGTSARPILLQADSAGVRWSGLNMQPDASSDSSIIRFALFQGTGAGLLSTIIAQHKLIAEDIRIRDSQTIGLWLVGKGSRAVGITLDSVGTATGTSQFAYALFTQADSVLLRRITVRSARQYGIGVLGAQGIVIDSSSISGSAQAGLVTGTSILAGGLSLSALNLTGNGAQSLRVDGANVIDARGLWWGDPAGPTPGQVTGNALTTPAAASPFVFP